MEKSVYSIVLSDQVVEAVDRMAYSVGTSRSNLINQILAEHLQLMTPEMRMREIFTAIQQLMEPQFRLMEQSSEAMMSIKSPVRYKYKPTVRYSIELTRDMSSRVAKLKVFFRTKSGQLIADANVFFSGWQAMEDKYLGGIYKDGVPAASGEGRYERDFYSPDAAALSDVQIAGSIAGYIRLMDRCIQLYFDGLSRGKDNGREIEEEYRRYIKEKGEVPKGPW